MAECRTCGAPIKWVLNANTGGYAPIDTESTGGGNLVVTPAGEYRVLRGEELIDARARGVPLFLSHFATCPDAATHRTRR